MTSESPKELWLTGFTKDQYGARLGRGVVSDLDHQDDVNYPKYTLTTHALAMVAAERDACAAIAEAEMKRNAAETYSGGTVTVHRSGQSAAKCYAAGAILEAIRARTTDDERAALDALLKAERVKALREAADCIGHITQAEDREAIYALIEKETDNE